MQSAAASSSMRHEGIGADIQNPPRQDRHLAAREPGHDRVERALRRRRRARDGAAIEAVGRSGSTTTKRGRAAPKRSHRYEHTPAAKPPTPPCTNTWEGTTLIVCASASSTIRL